MSRQASVARSVVRAVQNMDDSHPEAWLSRLAVVLRAFFTLHRLTLRKYRGKLFVDLRAKWFLNEEEYQASFLNEGCLERKGDMGFSGSTFFNTKDGRYLIKSVPRHFEHSFFRDDFLKPYVDYMLDNLGSFLIRITDFLACDDVTIGSMLGTAPTHHIIMENLLSGKDEARASGGGDWETWDLKPTSFFFPERDIAGGKLTSDETKAKLADTFDDKIFLTQHQVDDLLKHLERDTLLLQQMNAVDYSLFLIRIPLSQPQNPFADEPDHDNAPSPLDHPPFAPPEPPTWRTGIQSADGKYVFRAAILDFFWAKHKTHAKFMTALIKAWNLIDQKGPMSITTTPEDYRNRFLDMVHHMVEVRDATNIEASDSSNRRSRST